MPERSTISQTVQIGVETTPGTAVPANKKLSSLSISPGVSVNVDEFKPTGQKYNSLAVLNEEWVEADLGGKPTYDEVIYVLASILGKPTSAQIMDGATPTGAYRHTFAPLSSAADDVATFTVEQGSAVRAHKFAYGLVKELGLTWSRDGLEYSGTMLGQTLTDGITMTAAPTAFPLVPILPKQLDVFMDATAAALGTTKLLRVLSGEWNLSDRFGPLWTLNSALGSFAAHVETDPTAELKLMFEADATAMGLLATLRAGDTKFIRLKGTGPSIYAGGAPQSYSFQLDVAVKVNDANAFDDADGVFAIEWPFTVVHDDTWGKAMAAEVINKTTAL